MKLLRFIVGLTLLTSIVLLSSCESPPTHMFYIFEEGCQARTADGDIIDPFWVFPGDQVIWINIASKDMTITFESDAIFGVEEFTVTRGGRKILTVEAGAAVTVDYLITPCDGAPGTPKGKVSDPP